MKNKFSMILLLSLLGILVIGGIVYFIFFGPLQASVSGDEVWVVERGRLKCEESSVEDYFSKWVDQNYKFSCGTTQDGAQALLDDCRVYASCGSTPLGSCSGNYKINGGSWTSYFAERNSQNKLLVTLDPGQNIEFLQTQKLLYSVINKRYTEIKYKWNPYQLHLIEGGGEWVVGSQDCTLANQDEFTRENIKAGEWDSLQKGEIRNYFVGWTKLLGVKIYDNTNYNNGNEVICKNRVLYDLESEDLANGETRKIQGDPIKSVDCCPNEDNNCQSDSFTFTPLGSEEERECQFDTQCQEFPRAVSDEEAVVEKCVDKINGIGHCEERTLEIECASNQKCRTLYGDDKPICSLALINYGTCTSGGPGTLYCGDGACGIGETTDNCQKDCGEGQLNCNPITEKETQFESCDGNPLCWVGLKDKKTITECRTKGWVYWAIAIGVLFLFILTLIIIRKLKRKEKNRGYK